MRHYICMYVPCTSVYWSTLCDSVASPTKVTSEGGTGRPEEEELYGLLPAEGGSGVPRHGGERPSLRGPHYAPVWPLSSSPLLTTGGRPHHEVRALLTYMYIVLIIG